MRQLWRSIKLRIRISSFENLQGDIKKISHDADTPVISDYTSSRSYTQNGFLKIESWEEGVTEAGSSGGPLFDNNKNVLGTLTGGDSDCKKPKGSDYYSRISLTWDYRTDTTKQLKYWLDPIKSGCFYPASGLGCCRSDAGDPRQNPGNGR